MTASALHAHYQHRSAHSLYDALGRARTEPAYAAFLLLRVGFAVLPIWMGIDKFANGMTFWPHYLAPWIVGLLPFSAQTAMYVVGAIEIVAGLVVALAPRFGGYLVAAWLGGIIVNLLLMADYYDIALRDFGLLLAALTLARLATAFPTRRQA